MWLIKRGLYSCRQRYASLQWPKCCATNWATSQSARFALVIEYVSSIHPWANSRRWISQSERALCFSYVILFYYTSDSLWKIWLVESIQSIHNSLWTWHDKCNICSRYCIYHVKFNVCLVTKPLGVFSSETKWLNAWLLLRVEDTAEVRQ